MTCYTEQHDMQDCDMPDYEMHNNDMLDSTMPNYDMQAYDM